MALAVPASVLLQVASGTNRKASSGMHMSMDLPSAMKCQASFLRQILQPAVVDKVCLRVSAIVAAMQMGQSEQHTDLKHNITHGMHLLPVIYISVAHDHHASVHDVSHAAFPEQGQLLCSKAALLFGTVGAPTDLNVSSMP